MTRVPIGALAALVVPACGPNSEQASSPISMFRGDPAHTGRYETRGVTRQAALLWTFETAGAVRSSAAVSGDLVVVGSSDGNVYAIDRHSGTEAWSVDVGAPVNATPAVSDGMVVVGGRDGAFHALGLSDGSRRWRFETGDLMPWEWGFEGWDYYTSSPVIQDSVVVFGSGDGALYALTLARGDELWRFQTQGRIRSSPAIAGGMVFVGSADGHAYAVELETGRERWRYATEGAQMVSADLGVDRRSIIASPAVGRTLVFLGSRDGYMYALDRSTGEFRWRASHDGSWAMSSPAITDERVYSGTSDGRWVHALDAVDGEEQWRRPAAGSTWSSPALVDSALYIGDGGGYLRAIDHRSGDELWNYRVGGGVLSSPIVSDGVVFFGSDDGKVYALHEDETFPERLVFWDEAFENFTYFRSHMAVRLFLEDAGYRTVGADSLAAFMTARVADPAPSVVVFAIDYLPPAVAATPSDTTLFRRYLAAGGKVVWLGIPPMILARDSATGRVTAFDRGRTTSLMGVDHSTVNFDAYNAHPTALGRSRGLTTGHISWFAIDPSDDIEVLTLDENERAGIWSKHYGGSPGSGFVFAGMERIAFEDLELIRTLAER